MKRLLLCCSIAALAAGATPAAAQSTKPFIGQLILVGFDFCPQNWHATDGALIPISQNTALFSILGTTYGGNGQTNFGLPDLRAHVPVGPGKGPGLEVVSLGQIWGEAETTIKVDNLPAHNHLLIASSAGPSTGDPAGAQSATFPAAAPGIYGKAPPAPLDLKMSADSIATTGASKPYDQHQPTLTLHYCICVKGEFPKRNN